MKISIITVCFNSINTIQDTIESVINQTYSNIEYVIVDGGSSDGTLDIISKYLPKINIFISEKDNGIYDAMNKGIQKSTGDVIGIINSDDFYNDINVISNVMNHFNVDDNLDIVYGDISYIKNDNKNKIVRKWNSLNYYNKFFENGNMPPHPSLFVKKQIYLESGNYDLNFHIAADFDFMLRIFKESKYQKKYIDLAIVKMRTGGISNRNFFKNSKELNNIWIKNKGFIPSFFHFKRIVIKFKQYIFTD